MGNRLIGGGRVLAALAALLAALPALASAQVVQPGAPVVVDGPSSAIGTLSGLSIARDGTGGLVYLKQVGGSAHVFVSRLLGGVFQPPQQIDSAFSGASSQPVIAAGNGGLLLVGFINGGNLYAVDRTSAPSGFTAPILLAGGAANPAIQATNFGKAYLAFTASAGGGHAVRAAYYYKGSWGLEPSALNASGNDDAGTGAGRPAVAAAGDGVALVVWGEDGHVYSRRVWGTSPSVELEQVDVPSLNGWTEVSADSPAAGAGGDSSYVAVAFHEVLKSGASEQSRVLMKRLQAEAYNSLTQPDGLTTPGVEGATLPGAAVGEYGTGLITSERQSSHNVWATFLTGNASAGNSVQVNSTGNVSAPDPVPAMAGLYSDFVAWQHDPGGLGSPEIRVRYSSDGSTFGTEMPVSSPAYGPTEAGSGLAAAGDVAGDAAVAYVQGTGSSTRIMATQLYRGPGGFDVSQRVSYQRTTHPLLKWSAAQEEWGSVRYTVLVDGKSVGRTSGTQLRVAGALSEGPHSWQVIATNQGGQQSRTRVGKVYVDTVPPTVKIRLTGVRRAGSAVRLSVKAIDPGAGAGSGSGIASITVKWGDGTAPEHIKRHATHVYASRGRFKVTVTVRDRAGNRTRVIRYLVIGHR